MKHYFNILFICSLTFLLGSLAHVIYDNHVTSEAEKEQAENYRKLTSPVVEDIKIVNSVIDDKKLYLQVVGKKTRQCGKPLAKWGWYGDPRKELKSITFVDDVLPNGEIAEPDAQEVGVVNFGWWELDPTPEGILSMTVMHICEGHYVYTTFGPFSPEEYMPKEGNND